jgi:predicted Zn-ribbon and HTH transcriptional regulator
MPILIQIPRLLCQRCSHEWTPRIPDVVRCPRCKNPRWNEPVAAAKEA